MTVSPVLTLWHITALLACTVWGFFLPAPQNGLPSLHLAVASEKADSLRVLLTESHVNMKVVYNNVSRVELVTVHIYAALYHVNTFKVEWGSLHTCFSPATLLSPSSFPPPPPSPSLPARIIMYTGRCNCSAFCCWVGPHLHSEVAPRWVQHWPRSPWYGGAMSLHHSCDAIYSVTVCEASANLRVYVECACLCLMRTVLVCVFRWNAHR